MFYFYIIYSKSIDHYYVGHTENLVERLQKHNSHVYSHAFTRKTSDWKYAMSFECNSREKAQAIEFFVKKMKSRKFIVKIVENPHIIPDLPL